MNLSIKQKRDSRNIFMYMWNQRNDKAGISKSDVALKQSLVVNCVCVCASSLCVHMYTRGCGREMEVQKGFWVHLVFLLQVILNSTISFRFPLSRSLPDVPVELTSHG